MSETEDLQPEASLRGIFQDALVMVVSDGLTKCKRPEERDFYLRSLDDSGREKAAIVARLAGEAPDTGRIRLA